MLAEELTSLTKDLTLINNWVMGKFIFPPFLFMHKKDINKTLMSFLIYLLSLIFFKYISINSLLFFVFDNIPIKFSVIESMLLSLYKLLLKAYATSLSFSSSSKSSFLVPDL